MKRKKKDTDNFIKTATEDLFTLASGGKKAISDEEALVTGPLRGSDISKQQSAESLATKGCVRCTLAGQRGGCVGHDGIDQMHKGRGAASRVLTETASTKHVWERSRGVSVPGANNAVGVRGEGARMRYC